MTKERDELELRVNNIELEIKNEELKTDNESLRKRNEHLDYKLKSLSKPYRRYAQFLYLVLGITIAGVSYQYIKHLEPRIEVQEKLVAEAEIIERYEQEKKARMGLEEDIKVLSQKLSEAERKYQNELQSGAQARNQLYHQNNEFATIKVTYSNFSWAHNLLGKICETGGVGASFDRADVRIWSMNDMREKMSEFKQRQPDFLEDVPMQSFTIEANKCRSSTDVNLNSYSRYLGGSEWIEATISGKDSNGHSISFIIGDFY